MTKSITHWISKSKKAKKVRFLLTQKQWDKMLECTEQGSEICDSAGVSGPLALCAPVLMRNNRHKKKRSFGTFMLIKI